MKPVLCCSEVLKDDELEKFLRIFRAYSKLFEF